MSGTKNSFGFFFTRTSFMNKLAFVFICMTHYSRLSFPFMMFVFVLQWPQLTVQHSGFWEINFKIKFTNINIFISSLKELKNRSLNINLTGNLYQIKRKTKSNYFVPLEQQTNCSHVYSGKNETRIERKAMIWANMFTFLFSTASIHWEKTKIIAKALNWNESFVNNFHIFHFPVHKNNYILENSKGTKNLFCIICWLRQSLCASWSSRQWNFELSFSRFRSVDIKFKLFPFCKHFAYICSPDSGGATDKQIKRFLILVCCVKKYWKFRYEIWYFVHV